MGQIDEENHKDYLTILTKDRSKFKRREFGGMGSPFNATDAFYKNKQRFSTLNPLNNSPMLSSKA